jgi:hypothetical protein
LLLLLLLLLLYRHRHNSAEALLATLDVKLPFIRGGRGNGQRRGGSGFLGNRFFTEIFPLKSW